MKLGGDRFSVPDCILDDGLPDKALLVLLFLFRCSDIGGHSAPGYAAIKDGTGIVSRTTVSRSLKLLRKHGWFLFVKKGNGRNSVFHLRIPPRFTETDGKHGHPKIRIFPRQ